MHRITLNTHKMVLLQMVPHRKQEIRFGRLRNQTQQPPYQLSYLDKLVAKREPRY